MADTSDSGQHQTNPWLIAMVVSMATFMEVMDTSIANVALRHIAGSMAVDLADSTWILTSYLVSNAIIVPTSGWLASIMGRKRFYMACVALFTVSSFMCGIAPAFGFLLIARVLQGLGGGGLAPSEQAILTDTFPAEKRGMAFAFCGVAVVVAPALGPTVGGWVTDHFSWRWIFFINLPVGVASLILTCLLVQDSPSAKKEHDEATRGGIKVDYVGFALVALGLGCLQVVLDKGQQDDWFGSTLITSFVIMSAIGIIGAIIWEFFGTKNPIVDLPLFRDRSFLISNIMMFLNLFVLLSTTQLLPRFVQEILPYNATKAGLILMPGGFVMMALMPVVGFLVRKVQPKYLVCFGFLISALALDNLCSLDTEVSYNKIVFARMFQGFGFAFLFVPIQTLAYSDLPEGKSNKASALINLIRNLGGSVGISVGTTLLARRSQVHQGYLTYHTTSVALPFQAAWRNLSHILFTLGTDSVDAKKQALAMLYKETQRQASMLSYLDTFVVLMVGSLIAAGLTVFLKTMDLKKASAH